MEDGDGTDLTQVYNPKTCLWTEVAPMQIARSGSAACTLKGKIYVIGKVCRIHGAFVCLICLGNVMHNADVGEMKGLMGKV